MGLAEEEGGGGGGKGMDYLTSHWTFDHQIYK